MYSQLEIFEIIMNCNSLEDLDGCARSFAHLIIWWDQPSVALIKKLTDHREKTLSNGSQV